MSQTQRAAGKTGIFIIRVRAETHYRPVGYDPHVVRRNVQKPAEELPVGL